MRVVNLGSTGMLGNAVVDSMIKHFGQDSVVATYRNHRPVLPNVLCVKFVATKDSTMMIPQCDFVINCVGVIKPLVNIDKREAILTNSIFPWDLSRSMAQRKIRVIHITTDCVFSGQTGKYTEDSPHDCTDFYGKSKSLGEPDGEFDNCMTIRTSIIGNEIHNMHSLVAWAEGNKGQPVNGFTNHLWNGVTTGQYGECCAKIIKDGMFQSGLFHVFSPSDVTKAGLLHMISAHKHLGLTIHNTQDGVCVDRTLRTKKDLCASLDIPELDYQIANLLGGNK